MQLSANFLCRLRLGYCVASIDVCVLLGIVRLMLLKDSSYKLYKKTGPTPYISRSPIIKALYMLKAHKPCSAGPSLNLSQLLHRLAVLMVLSANPHGALIPIGVECSSFVFMSRGSTRRSSLTPMGFGYLKCVAAANMYTSRWGGFNCVG